LTTVSSWTGVEARALRIAMRASVRAFAAYLGVAIRTVSKWESGGAVHVPRPDTQSLLDTALARADADVRARFTQLCVTAGAIASNRPDTSDVAGLVDSAHLVDVAIGSDLGPDILDDLDRRIAGLGEQYFRVAPRAFRPMVLRVRQEVVSHLDGRATLRQRRDLYASAAVLSGLLAENSLAVGAEAMAHCDAALHLAEEAGDRALAGWVRGTQAQVALHTGRPDAAVDFAAAGVAVSPPGSAALVRSFTYLARATARRGHGTAVREAIRNAERAWTSWDRPSTGGLFSLSPGYLVDCEMTSLVWSGEPQRARRLGCDIDDRSSTPTVGRAIGRIDLAIALAQTGEAEQAAGLCAQALDIASRRLTVPVRQRIEELLVALTPFDTSSVRQVRKRWAWISG